jgi:hypothetical protein
MRIESVLTGYDQQNQKQNSAQRNYNRRGRVGVHSATLLYDSVDLHDTTDEVDMVPEWLAAYIKLIPDDLAVERTEKVLFHNDSKFEILVDLLLILSI